MKNYYVRHWIQAKPKRRKAWTKNVAFTEINVKLHSPKNVKFRNAKSNFQATLQDNIRLNHGSKKTMTFANKTSNIYWLTKVEHKKLLRNAITSKYKKTNTKSKD